MRLSSEPPGAGELAALEAGISEGLDPQPSGEALEGSPVGGDGSRTAVTHSESWWTHLRCRTCGHTFRRGDRVRVRGADDAGLVVHLDPALRCADKAATETATDKANETVNGTAQDAGKDAEELAAFAAGLLAAWPPAGDVPIVRLAPHALQVARPDLGPDAPKLLNAPKSNAPKSNAPKFLDAPTCLVCGHTFRAGEHVVVCPCGMYRGFCVAAVHRDPVAGLTCWDDWRPDGALTHCPVTLNRVER
ncbi:hypothetical protein [Frankia sp. Cr2]|uniref:hypothetical protein n=1 Tax=Frankia sp. Cr2 TaxID=3073932 RepID=UPI002AD51FB8|nr:hypothetical protein [Frankia sp. Cr2]